MSHLELIAAVFGLACVWLVVRQNIWCWPMGLVQVALYVAIFYDARLYADMGLHVIYIFLQLYGWQHWLRGGPRENTLPVTRLPWQANLAWALSIAAGAGSLGLALDHNTNADLPYWDSAIVAMSLAAQYLLARKVLENWAWWIAVDVLGIGVYAYKELYYTAGLYAVFLGLSVWGWFAWRKSLLQDRIAVVAV